MIFTVLLRFIPANCLASLHSSILIFCGNARVESLTLIGNCSGIFSRGSPRFPPFQQSGGPHHSLDYSAETPTLFSSACGRNSTPPQFQAAFSKCPITFG